MSRPKVTNYIRIFLRSKKLYFLIISLSVIVKLFILLKYKAESYFEENICHIYISQIQIAPWYLTQHNSVKRRNQIKFRKIVWADIS